MVGKIWKLALIWISVLCLSSVVCIMYALESGLIQETYFTSGYVVGALICVMMLCTIISVILKHFTQLYEPNNIAVRKNNISSIAKRDLTSVDTEEPVDAIIEPVVEDKNIVREYDDTAPTKEECDKFNELAMAEERSKDYEEHGEND